MTSRLITPADLRDWPLPEPSGAKRSRGAVLAVGGSASTPGAVMLAGLAALRVGAGVLGLAVARSVAAAVAVAVPEASVTPLDTLDGADGDDKDALRSAIGRCNSVLVGPGLDDPDQTRSVLRQVLMVLPSEASIVLDAYALGVLPTADGVDTLAGRLVLTPNSSEAARLLEVDEDGLDDDGERVAAAIARRYEATVTYSGHVATDGRTWTVPTGHAGLGTSGSGDVLAGVVAGLLARGAPMDQAACWATYLHAAAGDRLAPRVGRLGFLAREVVDELPLVLVQTESLTSPTRTAPGGTVISWWRG